VGRTAPCGSGRLIRKGIRPSQDWAPNCGIAAAAGQKKATQRRRFGPAVSFRVLEVAARNASVAAGESSSWGIGCPFRVHQIGDVSRVLGFRDPALPLALAPAVRFSIVESGRSQLSKRRQTLVGLRPPYGVLPSNFQPVRRSRQATLMDFCSLQHMQDSAIALLCREFPILPALPPAGFSTLLTVLSRRNRAGYFSHRQRSWDSPFGAFPSRDGARCVSTRADPLADCSSGSQRRTWRRGRPGRPRLLGFDPCKSPLRPPCY
jgi:hypothetical protein